MRQRRRPFLLIGFSIALTVPVVSTQTGWQTVPNASDLITRGYWDALYQAQDSSIVIDGATLTAESGAGYTGGVNIYAPYLQATGAFGITANIEVSSGGSAWLVLAGSLTTGPSYWNNQKLLAVGLTRGQVSAYWTDGTSANTTGGTGWAETFTGAVRLEVHREGSRFFVNANGRLLGDIPDLGLFTSGRVFFGINVAPGSRLTVKDWGVQTPSGQQANVQLQSAVAQVTPLPSSDSLRALTTRLGLTSGVSDFGPHTGGAVRAPLSDIAGGGSYFIHPSGSVDSRLRELVATNWNQQIVVICCELFAPTPARFTTGYLDYLADFAANNGMSIYGSALVQGGNNLNPLWLVNGAFSRDERIAILRNQITKIVMKYKGRMHGYSAVNEAFDPAGTGSLRTDSPWMPEIGRDYIRFAFQLAHELDPSAELYLDEVMAENAGAKADGVYALARELVAAGVPITGVGMQSHFTVNGPFPYLPRRPEVEANMRRLAALGLKVRVSEMDVRILQPARDEDFQVQATAYAEMAQACLNSPNCSGLNVWDANENSSWIPTHYPGYGTANLFDESFRPRPAYFALQQVLQRAAARGVRRSSRD